MLCLAAFASVFVDGLWRKDAFDYAQIARELVEGEGLDTRMARGPVPVAEARRIAAQIACAWAAGSA